ncbi:MAG: 2-hydroxyacyl-CoA dehydratase family protein [Bacteroidota bacterium]
MNEVAEQYVRLILDIGQHDPDFVDAYYGPKEWQEASKKMNYRLTALHDRADAIMVRLKRIRVPRKNTADGLRKTYLQKQLTAASAKLEMLMGTTFTFDEEAKKLYDATPPSFSEKHFAGILDELKHTLPPGSGSVQERYQEFRNQFIIPKEKLDTVFQTAINECRKRTKQFIALPKNERFTVEYVNNKAWSGYNWYQGDAHSLIQVNTDFPIFIDRAVDLAAHEGYPGHHVYNVLLESELLKKKGWIEFCIYPLFSPQSLIAEGSANYGINVVLPEKERLAFEKKYLFPVAGLDPSKAEQYYTVQALFAKLAYAGNEAARGYLNGTMTKEKALMWLTTCALFDSARAEQRLKFIEKYRSYVINYNLGQDLVKKYVEKKSGKKPTAEKRWKVFSELISSPRLPGGLQ